MSGRSRHAVQDGAHPLSAAIEPITTTRDLVLACARLARYPFVTVDTEFLRETTYYPLLCVAQIASADEAVVIDTLAPGLDLQPFFDLMVNEHVLKVFHAARQDIEIVWHMAGRIPHPIFDTQVAAMVLGYGDSISYDQLVQRITGDTLDKSNRFTDWSRRPLSKRQLEYALADVTHLRVVYEALAKQLERTGRTGWVAEEIEALQDPALYKLDPTLAWKRLKPRTTNKRFLAILASLAEWREREAQTRDLPRNRVIKDEALMEIAAHPPAEAAGLDHIRAVPKGFAASRLGKSLLEALAKGQDAPPPDGIEPERPRRKREPSPSSIDLLKTLLRLRAEEAGVAPRLIANADDIERIAAHEDQGVAALTGWRADVFGRDAKALRDGKLAIALEKGEAVVVELEE